MANKLDNNSNVSATGGSKGVNVTSMINEFAKQNRDTKIENAKNPVEKKPAVKLSKKQSGIDGVDKKFTAQQVELKEDKNKGVLLTDKASLGLGTKGVGGKASNEAVFGKNYGGEMGVRGSTNVAPRPTPSATMGIGGAFGYQGGGEMGARGTSDVKGSNKVQASSSAFSFQGGGEMGARGTTDVKGSNKVEHKSSSAFSFQGGGEMGARGTTAVSGSNQIKGSTSAFSFQGGGEIGARGTTAVSGSNQIKGSTSAFSFQGGGEIGARGTTAVSGSNQIKGSTSAFSFQGGGEIGARGTTAVSGSNQIKGTTSAFSFQGGGEMGARGTTAVSGTNTYTSSGGGYNQVGAGGLSKSSGIGQPNDGFKFNNVNNIVNSGDSGYSQDKIKDSTRSMRRIKFGTGETLKHDESVNTDEKTKPLWAKIVIAVSFVLVIALFALFCYVGVLEMGYVKLYDNKLLEVSGNTKVSAQVNQEYTAITSNMSHGIMDADNSYVLYGGKNSSARNEDMVSINVKGSASYITEGSYADTDFYFLQEVDNNSTRSFYINQKTFVLDAIKSYAYVNAEYGETNYIITPISTPIGSFECSSMFFSKYRIKNSIRRALASEQSFFGKYKSSDNHITVTKIYVAASEVPPYLIMINVSIDPLESEQTKRASYKKLKEIMATELLDRNNYVIVGGSFGCQLYADSDYFGDRPEWCDPLPADFSEQELAMIGYNVVRHAYEDQQYGTFRDTGEKYKRGETYESVFDGFIVSSNIEVKGLEILHNNYLFSSHSPVRLKFSLVG